MLRVLRVRAPNPGPFTLEGTNTWIVGDRPSLVIDPGPNDPDHVREVRRAAEPVGAILLTHHHEDHAPAGPALAEATGAPILAFRPVAHERKLHDGTLMPAGGGALRAIHAPGHAPDHVVYFDPESAALFTGDAVLGRGTSVIDPPDGDMTAYMRALSAMLALEPRVIYPGHGPTVWEAKEKLMEYLEHRKDRERQVLAALDERPATPEALVPRIYAGYPEELHPAAARTIEAHLLKLVREGRAVRTGRGRAQRFARASGSVCDRCGRPVAAGSKLCDRCGIAALQEGPPVAGRSQGSEGFHREDPSEPEGGQGRT